MKKTQTFILLISLAVMSSCNIGSTCEKNDPECTVLSCLQRFMELRLYFKEHPDSKKTIHEYFKNIRENPNRIRSPRKTKQEGSHTMGILLSSPIFAERAKEIQQTCSHLRIDTLNTVST